MAMTLEVVELTSSLEAASQAREAVRAALDRSSQDTIDHACLIVDELVAGALVAVGAPVRLVLESHADHLVVEVLDAGISEVAVGDRIGIAQTLLDTWATAWGSLEQASGTSVWFNIAT
ncbi:MAG TPA: hypothetical protein VK507_12925 [Iamia sp.]|nr:hypothetical protein [Iamia sp.]